MATTRSILNVLESYQKSRLSFVQSVSELASKPQVFSFFFLLCIFLSIHISNLSFPLHPFCFNSCFCVFIALCVYSIFFIHVRFPLFCVMFMFAKEFLDHFTFQAFSSCIWVVKLPLAKLY